MKSISYQIIHYFLTRIIVGLLVITGMLIGGHVIFEYFLSFTSLNTDSKELISSIGISSLCLMAYYQLYSYYENRKITELSKIGMTRSILIGIALGAFLQILTLFTMYLLGYLSVSSINRLSDMLPALSMAISAGIIEELIFRGILFRITEEKLGSNIALLLSALFFGAAHISNPNSTIWTSAGIAIQAGLLLGVAYMYMRNLWFPMGIHFAWNFTQSGIFGANTSGNEASKSLFSTISDGPEIITGGAFGPEGSIQATVFCLLATLILFRMCVKDNQIIKPYWKRKNHKV